MRLQDQQVFQQAARVLQLWILVRPTNPHSLEYIGRHGYQPKPLDCKAKTAKSNVGLYQLQGLVASPKLHPSAFSNLADARELWRKTVARSGFTVDEDKQSPHYGCLRRMGKYIHADYDLKDIVIPGQEHRNLALVGSLRGVPHRIGARFFDVQSFVNRRIGVPMVQHAGEAQFDKHSPDEAILVFQPDGVCYSMLPEGIPRLYAETFKGRPTLGNT